MEKLTTKELKELKGGLVLEHVRPVVPTDDKVRTSSNGGN